jgi:hypothetical protein
MGTVIIMARDGVTANMKSEFDMATDLPVPVESDNVILVESESRLYPLIITMISRLLKPALSYRLEGASSQYTSVLCKI